MQSWLEGVNWVRKGAQATGMTASLRILSSKANSNTWERFTRSELKLESVHQESPRSDIFRKSTTKPLLKKKHCQKHLTWAKGKNNWTVASGPKSSFQMKVNVVFHLEIKVWSLEKDWRGTEYMLLEVQCEVSTVSDDLGCHVICWCWSTSTRRFWSTLSFHLLTNCMEMLISFSSKIQHLPTLPKPLPSGLLTTILLCLIGQPTCLTWTPDGIYGIFSRERWETVDQTIQMSWILNSASAVPQADRFHATPHWCCYMS